MNQCDVFKEDCVYVSVFTDRLLFMWTWSYSYPAAIATKMATEKLCYTGYKYKLEYMYLQCDALFVVAENE